MTSALFCIPDLSVTTPVPEGTPGHKDSPHTTTNNVLNYCKLNWQECPLGAVHK